MEMLDSAKKVVGTRKVLRSIESGEVSEVFIARDADLFIVRQIRKACTDAGVRMTEVETMKELGKACGVEVKTASAALKK